jgi:predicted nucleic acid-binding protein
LKVYADSSFLVSLYLTDQLSADARKRVLTVPSLFRTPLHDAEWAHAIAQHVFRGSMSPSEARRVELQWEADKRAVPWVAAEISEAAFILCADLGRRQGPKLGVRTLDSLHVACALELKVEHFWTFDERQAKLARAEGLKTS